jgi:hypothetical protein
METILLGEAMTRTRISYDARKTLLSPAVASEIAFIYFF